MALKDRLREVRKAQPQKMSQSAFAEMLGTKRDTIANYEGGRVEPTDTFIQLLCTKFHINEQWLRTGEGEMRSDEEDAILEAFSKRYDLTPDEQTTARYMLRLSPEQRAAVLAHVKALAAELTAQVDAAKRAESAAKEQRTMTDEEIEADVAAYRAALIAEKEAASASSSGSVAKRA